MAKACSRSFVILSLEMRRGEFGGDDKHSLRRLVLKLAFNMRNRRRERVIGVEPFM